MRHRGEREVSSVQVSCFKGRGRLEIEVEKVRYESPLRTFRRKVPALEERAKPFSLLDILAYVSVFGL